MKRYIYRILRLLREKSLNYNELLEQMWGIYPEDLNKAIKRLKEEDLIIEETSGIYQLKEVSTNDYCEIDKDYIIDGDPIEKVLAETSRIISKIPAPHPQDYDWRFTNDAIKSFYFEIVKYISKQDKLCIVAAPSLYIFLKLLNRSTNLYLIEKSAVTARTIIRQIGYEDNVIIHDLQQPCPDSLNKSFDFIVMDPPWYKDYYDLFFERALELSKPGGVIQISLFPVFTRENASEERAEIISNAMGKGLSLIRLNDCAVEYETPSFERQALREKLIQVNHAWRKGDIATFYLGKNQGKKDHAMINLEKGEWIEYEYGTSRIKIKVNGDRIYDVPSINTVEKDRPVIPTVSRRYEKRDLIDLWTSNNQGYKITCAHIVKTLLEYVIEKKELAAAVHALAKEFSIPEKQIENDCSESFQIIKDILEREMDYEGRRSL